MSAGLVMAAAPSLPQTPSFDAIAAEYGAALFRVASAYASDNADAQDLYQDISYAIWRALPRFRGESSIRTFVWRIAHNRGLTHRARRAREHDPLSAATEVPDPHPTPDQTAADVLRHEKLLAAIRGLTPAQREVLLLSLEGLSHGEIGEVLGVTENVVGVRLNRARRSLRERLDARSMEP